MENVIKGTVSLFGDRPPQNGDEFATRVINPTPFHTELTIKARLYLGHESRWFDFPADHCYGGRPWALQAMESFSGSLGLPAIMKAAYGLKPDYPNSAHPDSGDWLEFTVAVMGDDAPAAHKVYFRFDGKTWQREPGKPDFA